MTAIVLAMISSNGLTYYLTVLRPASQQATAPQHTATTQTNGSSPAALQDLYTKVTRGKPTLNSPLNANDNNNWTEYDSKAIGSCVFKKGAYYVRTVVGSPYSTCADSNASFSDLAYQVEMIIIRGDIGGIYFRGGSSSGYYRFLVKKDGYYSFSSRSTTILNGFSPLIATGLNHVNTVAVIAHNTHFYFYVNKHYIAQASDNTSSSGYIGLAAQYTTHVTEVEFRNAQVWKL